MKRFKILIICVLVVFGCSTMVMAQKHRHTERNDSTEALILGESSDSLAGDDEFYDYTIHIDTDLKNMRDVIDGLNSFAGRADGNELNFLGGLLGVSIGLAGIAIFLLIICPLILFIVILWLIFRPSKKEKKVAKMAASDPATVTINAEPQDEALVKRAAYTKKTAKKDKTAMEDAIMKMAVGLGLVLMGMIIDITILIAVGMFLVVYGLGKLAIAKFVNKDDEKPE